MPRERHIKCTSVVLFACNKKPKPSLLKIAHVVLEETSSREPPK